MWLLAGCEAGAPPAPAGTADSGVGVEPACETVGCLRAETSYGAYSRADLAPYLEPGVALTNGYEVVGIEYLTERGPATATVTLPLDLVGPEPAEGFPLVANAHGTVGVGDTCQLTGTTSGTGLAALFGGRGAIGVAPDYVGLGTPGHHRYLSARDEATSVLDALRAAAALAKARGVRSSGRAAVVGMSQGGHAALATAALHAEYAPDVDLRAVAAAGPANVYEEQWRTGVAVPGEHLVLHALMAWSFAEAAGADDASVWAAGVARRVDDHLTRRCWWSPAFTDEPLLADDFPTEPAEVFDPAFLEAYSTGRWGPFGFMGAGFDENRLRPWPDAVPVAIWQGELDTTVLPWMTRALVHDLRDGGVDVELHEVAGATHTTTAFGFLAVPEVATEESVAWVLGHLRD